jgi:hypothetical protein
MKDFKKISPPKTPATMLTVSQVQGGPPIEPLTRILVYDSTAWETFIDEWVSYCLKSKYQKVLRFTGANDRGIDVAGFVDDKLLEGVWDNYQCKHYDVPIPPSVAWPEIGKILWHSFNGHYRPPGAYYFVAPRGTGTTLTQYLANTTTLKTELLKSWDKRVRDEITTTQSVALEGKFAEYVRNFDFSIFKPMSVREVVEQHRTSPYFITRFGGGLPARPKPAAPPDEIQGHESTYVGKLLDAYADHTKAIVPDIGTLTKWTSLDRHFKRQREAFFHAESLRVFVRDKVEPGTFESLQDEIYHGVIDTHDRDHVDGYQRVVAVTTAAQNMQLDAHPLAPSTLIKDRYGICHQLANEDRLQWKK